MSHPEAYYHDFVQSVLDRLVISKVGTKQHDIEVRIAKNCINQWVGV